LFDSAHYLVNINVKGVEWMGRHFNIRPYGTGINISRRPYSVILSLSSENIKLRSQIVEFFKIKTNDPNAIMKPITKDTIDKFSETIGFIIKK